MSSWMIICHTRVACKKQQPTRCRPWWRTVVSSASSQQQQQHHQQEQPTSHTTTATTTTTSFHHHHHHHHHHRQPLRRYPRQPLLLLAPHHHHHHPQQPRQTWNAAVGGGCGTTAKTRRDRRKLRNECSLLGLSKRGPHQVLEDRIAEYHCQWRNEKQRIRALFRSTSSSSLSLSDSTELQEHSNHDDKEDFDHDDNNNSENDNTNEDTTTATTYVIRVKGLSKPEFACSVGFVILDATTAATISEKEDEEEQEHVLHQVCYCLPPRSFFEVIYTAMYMACLYAIQILKAKKIILQLDHSVVVLQMSGHLPVQKNSLKQLYWQIMKLIEFAPTALDSFHVEWIPSSMNRHAKVLAALALGTGTSQAMVARKTTTTTTTTTTSSESNPRIILEEDSRLFLIHDPMLLPPPTPPKRTKDDTTDNIDDHRLYSNDFFGQETSTRLVQTTTTPTTTAFDNDTTDTTTGTKKEIPVLDKTCMEQQQSSIIDPNHMYILQADGGCRGNPAMSAGAGMVIFDSQTPQQEVWCGYKFLFRATREEDVTTDEVVNNNNKQGDEELMLMTNNQAEYWALIFVLEQALHMGIRHVRVECDSNLVVKQVGGKYVVRNAELRPLRERAKTLSQFFDTFELVHIRRQFNRRADFLANHAMDHECDSYDATRTILPCFPEEDEEQQPAAAENDEEEEEVEERGMTGAAVTL